MGKQNAKPKVKKAKPEKKLSDDDLEANTGSGIIRPYVSWDTAIKRAKEDRRFPTV